MPATIDNNPVITPHFSLPFRFVTAAAGKSVAVQEQDSYEEIRDCVSAIVRYEKGQRPEDPDFGIVPQVFAVHVDTASIVASVQEIEPRVQLLANDSIDPSDEGIARIVLSVLDDANVNVERGGANV